jgi:hypothetical protein
LVKGTTAPVFQGTSDRKSAVTFNCVDEETVKLLKSLMAVLSIKQRLQLRALGIDGLPKRHQFMVHVENSEMTAKEVLELLDRQNKDLASNEWVVVRDSKSRNATSAHFVALISDQQFEVLKVRKFKPYCGLSQRNCKTARQGT